MEYEKFIENRMKQENYEYFKYGDDYYNSRNTYIMNRKKQIYLDGVGITENPFGSNHKLASGHFKKIVDQKVMYVLGKGVNFAEDGQNDMLNEYFEDTFDETIIDGGISTSKKGEAWLYAFKFKNKLKFTFIPSEQLTPIYDEYNQLVKMIRRYDTEEHKFLVVYTDEDISIYKKAKTDRDYKLFEVIGHWSVTKEFNGKLVGEPEQHGFGVVPFIPLYNNKDKKSDLYSIKSLIDTYDIINSDFANNIDDMQEAFFYLKGYTGDVKHLGEFMRQLKMYKAIPVGDDGDVSSDQLEIPTEARKVFLERLEKDIYKFAMGVDLSNMDGGSITNVYIKAMFADLDLKADQFESEVRKFIYKVIDFINVHDNKSFSKEFNLERSMIINRQEVIDGLVKLTTLLSQKTILELLPYEIDMEQEEERLAEEKAGINLQDPFIEVAE